MISLSKEQFSYLIVTSAYWVFMLSDGALRMLVLLHFHQNGFSPLQLAYLFLFMSCLEFLQILQLDGWPLDTVLSLLYMQV